MKLLKLGFISWSVVELVIAVTQWHYIYETANAIAHRIAGF